MGIPSSCVAKVMPEVEHTTKGVQRQTHAFIQSRNETPVSSPHGLLF